MKFSVGIFEGFAKMKTDQEFELFNLGCIDLTAYF